MAVKQSTNSACIVGVCFLLASPDSYCDTSKPANYNYLKCAPNLRLSVLLVPYINCCTGFILPKLQCYIVYGPQNYEHLLYISMYLKSSTEVLEVLLSISKFCSRLHKAAVSLEKSRSYHKQLVYGKLCLFQSERFPNDGQQKVRKVSKVVKNADKNFGKLCFAKNINEIKMQIKSKLKCLSNISF